MIKMICPFLTAVLLSCLVGCSGDPANELHAMPTGTGFSVRTVKSTGNDHKYSIFIPRDYSPSKEYPTIVFLHGIGEAGGDGKACRTVGIGPNIGKRDGNFPFIVLFPQAGWDWTGKDQGQLVVDVVNDAKKDYAIDMDRLCLTGMSSGGKGTWVLGARYRGMWACLVPMGGYADYDDVPTLSKMHIWALHNSGDWVVNVGGTREMYKRLKATGADIHYTEYDAFGHNCWDAAYNSGELFTWMQQQKRGA